MTTEMDRQMISEIHSLFVARFGHSLNGEVLEVELVEHLIARARATGDAARALIDSMVGKKVLTRNGAKLHFSGRLSVE